MINRDSQASQQNQPLVESPLELNNSQTVTDQQDTTVAKERIQCLDIYRGFTIFGMILVDNVGCLRGSYWWLVHAEWNGLTLADLIFPAFLFILGMAIPLAVNKKRPIRIKNIVRIFLLFGIGLFLNLFGAKFQFQRLRILGILQRMSICYAVVLVIHWASDYGTHITKRHVGACLMAVIVALYVILMVTFEDASIGCFKSNNLEPFCNFAGFVDRLVLTQAHMYERTDPEGIVPTMTASFTTYVGYCFGLMIVSLKGKQQKMVKYWLLFALICLIPIYPCSLFMPLNKKIYSITFLFAALSTTSVTLSMFLLLIDYLPKISSKSSTILNTIVSPLKWLGLNPLAIYIILQLVFNFMFNWFKIDDKIPYYYVYDNYYGWMGDKLGTILYGLSYALIYTIIAGLMFKCKLFLRL